jgi:predicted Zn-dependent protease
LPTAEVSLGYALLASGSYPGAVAVLERAVASTPTDATAQFYLGAAIRLSGDRKNLPKAEAALARAAEAEPNDPQIQYELGLARVQLRQWEPAREALEAAARLKPDLSEAARDLSRVRERTGDRSGAAIARSRYFRLVGDAAAAVRLLEPLSRSGDLDLNLELCEAYYDNLQTPLTLRNLSRLTERHPKEVRVLEARFRGERAADHNAEALRQLTEAQALKAADDHSLDADRLGLLRETDRYDELEKALREAVKRTPNDAAAQFNLGTALTHWPTGQNRDVEAEQVLRRVLEMDSTHTQAHYDLALILSRTKRAPEAIVHLRTVLDHNPQMKDALRVLGQAYASTGDTRRSQDAYALYRQIEARESEQKRLELPSSLYKAKPQDRLNLADFYIRAANRQAAVIELETLLHKNPGYPAARGSLIGLYGQLRRFQRQFEERRLLGTGKH